MPREMLSPEHPVWEGLSAAWKNQVPPSQSPLRFRTILRYHIKLSRILFTNLVLLWEDNTVITPW